MGRIVISDEQHNALHAAIVQKHALGRDAAELLHEYITTQLADPDAHSAQVEARMEKTLEGEGKDPMLTYDIQVDIWSGVGKTPGINAINKRAEAVVMNAVNVVKHKAPDQLEK